jgi:nucleoside-diphosphate-sugar epimerase
LDTPRRIFVTGGTGYIGSRLIPALHAQGHEVLALYRPGSRSKLPGGSTPVEGNALDGDSYRRFLQNVDTFIHLIGVSHPSPSKAREFVEIDQKSALQAIRIASASHIEHFIYISVAQPAPVMRAYINARAACEQALSQNGLNSTILRPWYVLGPGHRWPYVLLPFYKLAEVIPKTRAGARRLGLVTVREMVNALVHAANNPIQGMHILEPTDIRRLGQPTHPAAANSTATFG